MCAYSVRSPTFPVRERKRDNLMENLFIKRVFMFAPGMAHGGCGCDETR